MAPPKKNAIFKTESPFSETAWPDIPSSTQSVILDLLCNLLDPIGRHRKAYHDQSPNGKAKSKKRKRTARTNPDNVTPSGGTFVPPPPAISNHVLVGLNSVTRRLSALAAKTAPQSMPASRRTEPKDVEETKAVALRPLSVVILPHPMPSSSLAHAHLPTLVYLSTTNTDPPTRLVALATASEARLATVLHLARVGAIGIIEGAPGAAALVDYVRDHVPPVECKWIEESLKAEWKGVKTGGD